MVFSSIFGRQILEKPTDTLGGSKSIYDFTVKDINGNDLSLSKFKGKKILIVNVASKCGFTPQYKELQQLHEAYGDKVVIIGFPANNFGGQEPGSNGDIAQFCSKNYNVTFQMMGKISVVGGDKHPLYQWLSSKEQNGWNNQEPTWNFCKYLISENGELLKFFKSGVSPTSAEIVDMVK
ncbi:MAG: glutathione peroxidase [Bacteroidota bacterium]|nr:glutathione peroxidase [Bacteroidota bacterium]